MHHEHKQKAFSCEGALFGGQQGSQLVAVKSYWFQYTRKVMEWLASLSVARVTLKWCQPHYFLWKVSPPPNILHKFRWRVHRKGYFPHQGTLLHWVMLVWWLLKKWVRFRDEMIKPVSLVHLAQVPNLSQKSGSTISGTQKPEAWNPMRLLVQWLSKKAYWVSNLIEIRANN